MANQHLSLTFLGGTQTVWGPLVGAICFVLLKHEISAITPYWHLVVGIILVAVVMSGANGLFGWIEARATRWQRRLPPVKKQVKNA